jgi:hypothetical protein
MTSEQIKEDIEKQINMGFSMQDIKNNMHQKGVTKEEIEATLKQAMVRQKETNNNSNVILYAILLIIIGLVYTFSLRPVSGGLRFPFQNSGDLIRWRELFFQPVGGIFLIVIGIILVIKKKKIGSFILRIIGVIWFSLLTFMSAFSNNLLNTLIGIATIVLIVILTQKNN